MDEQNFVEKIGIVRDLSDLKVDMASLRTKIESLYDLKIQSNSEIKEILKKHNEAIYGNGHEGIKTHVDRLNQAQMMLIETGKTRRAHLFSLYGGVALLTIKQVFDWVVKK